MNDDILLEPTLLRAVWRYRWLVLLITMAATAAAYFYANGTATEEWSAEASVVAEDPLSNVIFESTTTRRADYIADQVEFMRSGDVAEEAARLAVAVDQNFPYTGAELLENTRVIESAARITVRVVANGEEFELDCLVFATGFEVGTSFTRRAGYDIIGRDGRTLSEHWSDGLRRLFAEAPDPRWTVDG